jgi:hypothetical protein
MNLQQGNLVKVLHNGKEGIGYIYDNDAPEEKDIVLQIGISWKDGGTSNSSVPEAIKEGVIFQVVELKRTFEEVLLEAAKEDIEASESSVLDYFEFCGIDTEDQCFSIIDMAKQTGIELERLEMLLCNLEDEDIMQEIANGNYFNFDQYDRNQFNDGYPFE